MARAIHAASEAAPFRFVEVNCAALPANLLEAELFGYEKGAFTDARQAKQGLAEVAASGTLFLDEIGTLPLELQAKLLTFLESRTFRRVGGTADRRSDARIVAATNADVHEEVHAGRFREDLYYRLAVAQFVLPPLREIRSDIPMFAEHFVEKAAAYFRRPAPTLDPESSRRLQEYDWPGQRPRAAQRHRASADLLARSRPRGRRAHGAHRRARRARPAGGRRPRASPRPHARGGRAPLHRGHPRSVRRRRSPGRPRSWA